MKAWILFLILSAGTVAGAANVSAIDAGQWDKLQTRIQKDGTPMETEAGTYLSLSHVVPNDRTKPRQAEYISDVGYTVNGKYVPYTVSVVSEKWTINADGDWDIDQWIYGASVKGELRNAYHIHIVETTDSMVKDSSMQPVKEVSSPEMTAQWSQVLAPWMTGTF